MAVISSNTLFHFTKYKNLIGILENEFLPKYSIELFDWTDDISIKIGIPMVSFCDIPLSQINDHIHQYGHYGIGMSKTWAEENKLNPVLYLHKNSFLSTTLNNVLGQSYQDIIKLYESNIKIDSVNAMIDSFQKIFLHTKAFDGYICLKGKKEYKKFYNERKWRYVPNINNIEGDELILVDKQLTKDKLNKKNNILEKYKLSFHPDDIRYIIIKEENERLTVIKRIERIKSKYSSETRRKLNSKIISTEQIFSDF